MQPLSISRFLTCALLLASSPFTLATPTEAKSSPHEERGLSDLLSGVDGGNLTDEINNVIDDVTALIQAFATVIQELHNATNENDLLELLGLDVNGGDDEDDDQGVTNGTVGAVGQNATCPGMAVLFARGTAEPGNVGLYTGPSFFTALRNYINGSTTLAIQGIPYPATVPGFLAGGSPFGSMVMATLVDKTIAACPNTKIVLSGYSQGAMVVHNAMSIINAPTASSNSTNPAQTTVTVQTSSAARASVTTSLVSGSGSTTTVVAARAEAATETATPTPNAAGSSPMLQPRNVSAADVNARVISIVLFGDPRNGTAVAGTQENRVMSFCNAQDDICAKGGNVITLDHLTYNRDAPQAAMFVMQRSGLGVASADAMNQGMGNVPSLKQQDGVNGGMQIGSGLGLPGMGFK